MAVEDFAVPEGEEAEYLLLGLARLVELRGVETFVAAPLLLPEPRFFPDAVTSRAEGVSVLLRRLLAYAGLHARRLDVEIYGGEHAIAVAITKPGHTKDAAAWFMDVADGVYHFGVRDNVLADERGLIGTLGHEVAHAYRTHYGLRVRDRDV